MSRKRHSTLNRILAVAETIAKRKSLIFPADLAVKMRIDERRAARYLKLLASLPGWEEEIVARRILGSISPPILYPAKCGEPLVDWLADYDVSQDEAYQERMREWFGPKPSFLGGE